MIDRISEYGPMFMIVIIIASTIAISGMIYAIRDAIKIYFKLHHILVKTWLRKKYYLVKAWLINTGYRIKLFARINFVLSQKNLFNHIHIINFEIFKHFYETTKDLNKWAFAEEFFPHGLADLTDMYIWVKQIHHTNYKILLSLNYEDTTNSFLYWEQPYKRFKHSINKHGELHIIPSADAGGLDDSKLYFDFVKHYNKIQNSLYKMDSEKCQWIIERRKFFNI